MKKIIAGVLALTLVCGFIPFNNNITDKYTVYAQGETVEYTEGTYGVLNYKNFGDYIEISNCDVSAIEVEIPSEIDGVAVTNIGISAFGDCEALTSVTIPESVTSISGSAFLYCTSLASVTIPDSVTSIGGYAFGFCKNLTSVTIPDNVTDIGDCAFISCEALTSIDVSEANDYYSSVDGVLFNKDMTDIIQYPIGKTDTDYIIPNSVTNIAVSAFEACKTLTSVTFPNGVTSIGDYAFAGWASLTSVTIPDSVTSIGWSAFHSCKSLTSVTIPDGVKSISNAIFNSCDALTSIDVSKTNDYYSSVDGVLFNKDMTAIIQYPVGKTDTKYIIPDGVTNIGWSAFETCKTLTSVTIPDSVTNIHAFAFAGCQSLTSITIPDSVTNIQYNTFDSCESLTSVTIPASVTNIDWSAFYSCYALTSITIENPNCEIYASSLTISNKDDEFTGTIYGYENSTAQAYAEKYNRKFDTLENAPTDTPTLPLGDINGNNIVDSSDASNVLAVYALVSTGKESGLTAEQKTAADVNGDDVIDAADASLILAYYAHISTGGTGTLENYLKS